MKRRLKNLSKAGLITIGLVFVVMLVCLFVAMPAEASVSIGGLALMGFGLATSVPSDSLGNIRTLRYTHNAATVPGDTIVINGCVLVAVNTAALNEENVYAYAGKHTMPKEAPLVIAALDQVYWDAGAGKVTKTSGGNTPCGYCQEAGASADTTVTIMLQPTNTFAVGTITLATNKILVGSAGGSAVAQTMSGDATILASGALALADTTIKYATVNLTNAQIKALRATPKELVAAPGANKIVEFVSAVLFLDYGANVLTESADNLAVRYDNGTGAIASQAIEATGFIDASADTLTNALPKIDAIVAAASGLNKALVLHNTGDGEYAGNAGADTVMKVKVAYRIHDVTV